MNRWSEKELILATEHTEDTENILATKDTENILATKDTENILSTEDSEYIEIIF